MEVMVIYSSNTGNTKKLASSIFAAVPGDNKDMQSIAEYGYKAADSLKTADTYFVGFWTDKGTCDMKVIDILSELHGKNIALFGTCGMGGDEIYYHGIEQQVKAWIPDDNRYLGCFMCQGKMPIQVRRRYEELLKNGENTDKMNFLIRNFDNALLHPDEEDLRKAEAFATGVMESLKRPVS